MEVTDALTYLQDLTGNQADVIPGFMVDDRLDERAQVILIVTGLGGTAVDNTLFAPRNSSINADVQLDKPVEVHEREISLDINQSIDQYSSDSQELPSLPSNLDLPAFLRRRSRLTSQEM
jgi:cell division GTPase FtsZ